MNKEINFDKLKRIQENLARKVRKKLPDDFNLKIITGVDVSYSKFDNIAIAMAVSIDIKEDTIIEKKSLKFKAIFPYKSGFLAFREVPYYQKVLKKLEKIPDLLLVDGFGILHPRKIGSAAHLGILMKIPTIGIGKSKFVGQEDFIPKKPGEYAPVRLNNEILGVLLKPNTGNNIYISIGNLIELELAIDIVYKQIKPNKRLPEPLFLADKYSRKILKTEFY